MVQGAGNGNGETVVERELPSFDLPQSDRLETQPAASSSKGGRLWLWIVLAVLLGALLAAGGWYVWLQWSDYDRRTEEARRELSHDEVDEYDSSLEINELSGSASDFSFDDEAYDVDSTAVYLDTLAVDTVAFDEYADSVAVW